MNNILDEKPIIKKGTNFWKLFKKKEQDVYCLGNIKTNKFIKFYANQLSSIEKVLSLMNGERV